jgi:hypothetical protein
MPKLRHRERINPVVRQSITWQLVACPPLLDFRRDLAAASERTCNPGAAIPGPVLARDCLIGSRPLAIPLSQPQIPQSAEAVPCFD